MPGRSTIKWTVSKKFAFLLILLYTFFYIFPFPFDAFPQLDFIFKYYWKAHEKLALWAGQNILQLHDLRISSFSDSGDRLFDYVSSTVFFTLSVIISLVILFLNRKQNNYETLYAWLFIYIRYCIAFYMLVYGFDKIFKSHFPFPSLYKLNQPLGESSPQGLLWAFMGYSAPYTTYLGALEVLSGFLLFFRRTTAIGALLVLTIMLNVTIINFCYDVPVKLFALHMVAYTIFLLAPFFKSIFRFLILHQQTKLAEQPSAVLPSWLFNYRKIIKSIIIASFTLLFINLSITNMKTEGDSIPEPSLYGSYSTLLFTLNTDTLAPLQMNPHKWKKIIFDKKNTIIISMDDRPAYYSTIVDTLKKTIDFRLNTDTLQNFQLNYESIPGYLTLTGKVGKDSINAHLKRIDIESYPLNKRKFHWITEYPINN